MARLTRLLNSILGVGTQRRTSVSTLPRSDARIWEVRAKFHKRPRPGARAQG